MNIIYHFCIWVLEWLVKLGSLKSPKLRLMIKGRKGLFEGLAQFRNSHPSPLIWFHVASLGEYEQAKPVIKAFKANFPFWAVAVSFFSPSGYEHVRKKKQLWVDFITYIPFDTPSNAKRFVSTLQPKAAIFVKYDLWHNHLYELKISQIPVFLIAASFRKSQIYFKPIGFFFRKTLRSFTFIFTQNQDSSNLLEQLNIQAHALAGDPRFDNVRAISQAPRSFPEIEQSIHKNIIVVGSAWQEDMDILIPFINSAREYQFIIAPHEIKASMIQKWQELIHKPSLKYSEIKHSSSPIWDVLMVDNIGMLSSLYQFARIAYVGGAAGKGLHNILEPIAYEIPVVFAKLKKVRKFPEAETSKSYGCGFSVSDFSDFQVIMEKLDNNENYCQACKGAEKLVKDNLGSSDKIITHIYKYLSAT